MSATNGKTKPQFRAYTTIRYAERSLWHQIGAAWMHNDGQGLNIKLFAVPVDGQIVLRSVDDKSAEHAHEHSCEIHDFPHAG